MVIGFVFNYKFILRHFYIEERIIKCGMFVQIKIVLLQSMQITRANDE